MPFIQARAKFTNGNGKVVTHDGNILNVNKSQPSVLDEKNYASDKLIRISGNPNSKFYFVTGDKLVIEKYTSPSTFSTVIYINKTGWFNFSEFAPAGMTSADFDKDNIGAGYYIEPVVYDGDRYYGGINVSLMRLSSINFCKRFIFAASELAPAGIKDKYSAVLSWGETDADGNNGRLIIPSHLTDLSGLFDNAFAKLAILQSTVPKIVTLGQPTKMHRTFYSATSYGMGSYSVGDNTVFGEMDVSKVTDFSYCFGQGMLLNPDVENWDVSSATNMDYMFGVVVDGATYTWTRNLSGWCVSNITSEPTGFAQKHPMTAAQKPVWGTCPNPRLTSTASWYKNASLTTPVGSSTNLRDTYCVFDLKNVKGGEVLELTGHAYTLTTYTVDVTLLSDSSKLTSPIGFNTLYALYKSPDYGNIPMRTIPITIPQGITGNVRLVFKSSALTLHHSLDSGSSRFDFILKHNNVQIGAIATVYRS